jgi:hypothetical protein
MSLWRHPGGLLLAVALLGAAPVCWCAAAQQTTESLKSRMTGNPVDRARAFSKFGEALLKDARLAAGAGDYERAEKILMEYRDTVQQLHLALKGHVPNPEKRPNGFKQLQIHVRKGLQDIEDLVAAVPANLQPPFAFLHKEIDKLDRALIDDLFPRQAGRENKKNKP